METKQLIGLVLVVAGGMDFLLAQVILPGRIADEKARSLVTKALTATGLLFMAVGLAMYFG